MESLAMSPRGPVSHMSLEGRNEQCSAVLAPAQHLRDTHGLRGPITVRQVGRPESHRPCTQVGGLTQLPTGHNLRDFLSPLGRSNGRPRMQSLQEVQIEAAYTHQPASLGQLWNQSHQRRREGSPWPCQEQWGFSDGP